MAPRRRVTRGPMFDPERGADAAERNFQRLTGTPPQGSEDDSRVRGVSGAGGAATGFGRRAIANTDYGEVQWNPEVPYPQYSPTRSTNMDRPRTVASGYDETSQILRVTFRDGATYEYLGVPEQNWNAFRRTPSPGRYIDDVLNQFFYRPLGD